MKRKFTFLLMALLALFVPWAANAQQTLPYSYGFENNDLAAAGWSSVNNSPNNASNFGIFTDAKHSGNYGFKFSSYNSASSYDQYLISPQISASSEFVFQFYYAASQDWGQEVFSVGYSTTDNQPASFTYGDYIMANSAEWSQSEEFVFPAATKYVAIHYYSNWRYHFYVDDFTFTAFNSCPKPTGLTASNITATSATITWNGSTDSYKVVYGTAEGFNPDGMTPEVVSETTYTINDLTTDVTYTVAVKAVCGVEEESDWSQYSFTPTCPTITSFYCGDKTATTATLYWNVNGNTDSYELAYGVSSLFDLDNPETYTVVDGITTTYYQLENLTTRTTYKCAVRAACGDDGYGNWSSEITFTPSCPAPYYIEIPIVTPTTVTLSWSGENYVEGYTLAYGLASDFNLENPETYTSVLVEVGDWYTDYEITGLTPNVAYKCAVRSSCDGESQGEWSNPQQFTPCLKVPDGLTVSNIMATSATASWQASDGATNYTVAYGLASAFNLNDPTTYQTTEPTSATSVEITGLTAEQNYACAVKATAGDINSQWSYPAYFTPTAKQTLIANNGTNTSIDGFDGAPFNGYQVANLNVQGQFIIPASQLTAANGSSIVELEFYRQYSYYSSCGNWNIYLKEVDNTAVPYYFYDTDNDPYMELVYSGSIELTNSDLSITLDTPFEYNGRNLLVCFKETSTAGASNVWTPWYGVYTSEYTSIGYENNNGNVVQNQFLPKTKITYIPSPTRYNVVCDNGIENGSISAYPSKASAGTTVTLSAHPNLGYELEAWVKNDADIEIIDNQFIMPEHDVTISATFHELQKYTITCAELAEGTIHAEYNGETVEKAYAGMQIDLVANLNEGYVISEWTVNNLPIEGNSFTMPDEDVTVGASVKQRLELTINDGNVTNNSVPFYGEGSSMVYTKSQFIIPASSLTDIEDGRIYELTFYLNNSINYNFSCSWAVYMENVDETETLSNYLSVDETNNKFYEGTLAISDNKITINLTTPYKYEGGNLLIYFKQTGVNYMGGYLATNWKGIQTEGNTAYAVYTYSGGGMSQGYSFLPKMTFLYEPGAPRYSITLTQSEGGTISADKTLVPAGTEVTLSYEADDYHTFTTWVEDYDDVTIVDNKFTMPEHDVEISATFTAKTLYNITITPNEVATLYAKYNDEEISQAPEGLVINLSYDDLQPGYTFNQWKVVKDGKIDVEVIDNQFTMPDAPVTISAVFDQLASHTVTISQPTGGTVSVSANEESISSGTSVYAGTELTFSNTPNKNDYNIDLYKFKHYVVTEEGQEAQALEGNTYTMPNCNLTVGAVFEPLYFPTINSNNPNNVELWAGPDNMHLRQVGGQCLAGVAAGEYVFINAEDIEGYRKTITWTDSQGTHETITYTGDNRPCFVMPADNNVTVSVQYAVIQKYNIALDYNIEGGSITVSPNQQVAGGDLVHIYINNTNLHFTFDETALNVTYNEGQSSVEVTTVTEGSHYQFSMPEGNVTVHAEYTEDENYAVNIVKPEGCDFNVNYEYQGQNETTGNVYCGYKVYLSNLAITSGYRFDEWNVTYKDSEGIDQPVSVDVTEDVYEKEYFVMPQGPVTITANVTKLEEHTVTIVQTPGGTITVNGNSESFQALEGSTITMSYSNLLEGFIFDSWIIKTTTETYQTTNSSFSMLGEDLSVEALFLRESIVNDGSSYNYNIPFHQTGYQWYESDYNYVMTRSQFIIPATDLENVYDASITDMTFYTDNNAYEFDATWKVYIKEVEYTQFEETYQYEDVTNMTQVYNGTMTIANNMMKVHFDTPYQYNDGNLMISFVQQTENDNEEWHYWYGVNSTNYSDRLSFGGYDSNNYYSNFLPKTKFSYKPSETPTQRYEITVNEVTGATLSASRNLAAAGTVITLTQETDEEYDFNNWVVTTATGGSVTVDENNQFTMPAANVTVSANVTPKPHYIVTLDEEMENGTLTLTPASEIGYMEGTTVRIEVNPNTGYKFDETYGVKAWKADDSTIDVEVTTSYSGYSIEMPEYNIVISARFTALQGYSLICHVNGERIEETVYENERIQPSDPEVPAGTTFVGWVTSDIATYSETEPALYQTGGYPTANVELYAVFSYADQSKWVKVTDNLQLNTAGGDRVIFVDDNNLGKVMCDRTAGYNYYFNGGNVEIEYNAQTYQYEIASLPANAVIFTTEKSGDNWKFHYTDVESWIGETTLSHYGDSNINPASWGGSDIWNINAGYVNNATNINYYLAYDQVNNRFKASEDNWAHMYIEVMPENGLEAYFTEVLSISGDENMNEDKVVRNLLINEGASYTVDGAKLTVSGFTKNVENIAENFVVTDGGQLEHYTDGVIATFQKDIIGYNTPGAIGDGWYFIANPTANPNVNLKEDDGSYDLYTFNPAAEAEWHNEQYDNGVLIPEENIAISREKGYLYANRDNFTLKFEGALNPADEDKTINLVYYDGGEPGREFPGFNLIGNPFSCTAYISGEFSIFKLIDGSEVQISEDGTVDPCEAFFVEATEDGESVTLSTTAPTGKSYTMPIVVNSDRGETLDRAILHLEGTRNSHKFMMNPSRTNISFPKNGERFASVSRGDEAEIPMNFTADHKGTYTISVNTENFEEEYLHLIDVISGDDIDLLVTPSYTFEADADEYASRFRLVFGTTGINDDPATSSAPFVYISNGNLVINNVEGTASLQIVDMLGRIVRTETVSGSYNRPHNLKAGAYVITLDGRAQRIVIE